MIWIMTARGWRPIIKPAENHNSVDVYLEVSEERMAVLMEQRSEKYIAVLRQYLTSGMTTSEFTNHPIHKEDLTNLR